MICHWVLLVMLVMLTAGRVQGANLTAGYVTAGGRGAFASRQSRLISFNTLDDGDISVELDFSVPFISIPVKKSLESAKGAIANINLGAVALAGAMALGIAIILPALMVFAAKKMNFIPPETSEQGYSSYRENGGGQSELWRYVALVDDLLLRNDIDTTTCMQRMLCSVVAESSGSVRSGGGGSTDKIIDGLATNQWLQQALEGTPMHVALQTGLGQKDCVSEYSRCNVTSQSVRSYMDAFSSALNIIKK